MTMRGWAAVILLAIDGLIAGVSFSARLNETALIRKLIAGQNVTESQLLASDASIEAFARLHVLGFVLAAIAFLVWLYSATKRAQALGTENMAFTPRASVLWWFVPFANLIQGYRAVHEVWKASDPRNRAGDPRYGQGESGTWLLMAWWLSYTAANIASRALPSQLKGDESVDDFIRISTTAGWVWAAVAISAALAIAVVVSIERRLAEAEAHAAMLPSVQTSAPEINPGFPPPP
jgi:hypothetical protein